MRFWRRSGQRALDPDSRADFLEFVSDALRSSYGQRFQDLFGAWENGFSRSGYFVEFGALSGRDFSNSYLLEQIGWRGVVAEPHPAYEKRIRRFRKCYISTKCVLDRTGDTVTFHAVQGRPALSTVEGFGTDDIRSQFRENYQAHEVETITLADLLDEAGAPEIVDFLSIDTEGSEPVILGAYDFERRPIRAIAVEHNDRHRDELFQLLTSRGYRRKWPELSGHDDWYVHAELELRDRDVAAREEFLAAASNVPTFENGYEGRVELLASLKEA